MTYDPERVSYDGHGITPDYLVENTVTMMSANPQREDPQRAAAREELVKRMTGMPMPM